MNVGIQMYRFDQAGEERHNVRMHQFQQAQPDKEQERTFHELEHCNRCEAGLVRARRHRMKRLPTKNNRPRREGLNRVHAISRSPQQHVSLQ